MKGHKKELAANIAETIQDKLKNTVVEGEQLKKEIKKTAKKLAEKMIKIAVKQEKKLKKSEENNKPELKEKSVKKKKTKIGLKGTPTTERELLATQKPTKNTHS
jgi:hypothetical protein